VLTIAGSPRRRGNSDRLLDAAEAAVLAAGGSVYRVVASQSGVAPCRGCNACSKDGRCVVRDAMDDLNEAFDSADALLIATPVFFATVPAVLKVIYDRCQPYWARRYVLGEPAPQVRRPAGLLLVGGGGDPYGTGCAVTPTRSVIGVLGFEMLDVLEASGDEPGDVESFPGAIEGAREMGRRVAEEAVARGFAGAR
jgi:multimeric flavodoxin WrbA